MEKDFQEGPLQGIQVAHDLMLRSGLSLAMELELDGKVVLDADAAQHFDEVEHVENDETAVHLIPWINNQERLNKKRILRKKSISNS